MTVQLISRQENEQLLCERFLETVDGRNQRNQLRSALRNLFREFSTLCPGESVLSRTRDTLWIPSWIQTHPAMGRGTRFSRLYSLRRIMRYQYDCGCEDANIFELVRLPCPKEDMAICFPHTDFSIQRQVDIWLEGVSGLSCEAKRRYRAEVLKFAVFSGQTPGPWPTQKMIEDWVKSLEPLKRVTVWSHVHSLGLFLRHLHEKRLIADDPLGQLRREYPARGLRGIVAALAKAESEKELARLRSQQVFRGPLAREMRDYLSLKRSTGRIYEYEFSGSSKEFVGKS
jgi:hypothetical protein